jgi:hypothetical protein
MYYPFPLRDIESPWMLEEKHIKWNLNRYTPWHKHLRLNNSVKYMDKPAFKKISKEIS